MNIINFINQFPDVATCLDFIKEQIKSQHKLALISFDDAYNYYYKYFSLHSLKTIVSKRYFEKYLYYKIADHIVYEKFIETSWIFNN